MSECTNLHEFDMRTITLSKEAVGALDALGSSAEALVYIRQSESSDELNHLREDLLSELNRKGWVVVHGLTGEPERMLLELASLVGTIGIPVDELDAGPLIMDIKPEKPIPFGMEISSRSATAFDFHTDLSYVPTPPDFITNLCIQPDIDGKGRTIISDVRNCLDELTKQTLEELSAPQFTFIVPPRCRGGVLNQVPILTKNRDKDFQIRIRFDKLVTNSELASAAVKQLYEALHSYKIEFLLEKNAACIVDNRRMVHGRTNIEYRRNKTERYLKRVYGMRLSPAPQNGI